MRVKKNQTLHRKVEDGKVKENKEKKIKNLFLKLLSQPAMMVL